MFLALCTCKNPLENNALPPNEDVALAKVMTHAAPHKESVRLSAL